MTAVQSPRSVVTGAQDLDSHEGIPFHLWHEHFGDLQDRWRPLLQRTPGEMNVIADQVCADDAQSRDDQPIDPATIWRVKGAGAWNEGQGPDELVRNSQGRRKITPRGSRQRSWRPP